jgi:hypothetical protein
MRPVHALAMAVTGAAAIMAEAEPANAVCSVFSRHPCVPTVCSVYQRRPCIPDTQYPIGEDLRLTIETAGGDQNASKNDDPDTQTSVAQVHHEGDAAEPEHKLDSIREMFDALRGCWVPPPIADARPGMQMSVRLSFKRTGEMIGQPRLTYVTPEASKENRDSYRHAIDAALERCSPMPFSKGMGGAVAGRPIAIRFVDNRTKP